MAERLGDITHTLPKDLLRSDVYIHQGDVKTHTPHDLERAERYYKRQIFDLLNGDTVGKTVFIAMNDFFVIRAATKAAWDLGCAVFNQEGHPAYRVMPEFRHFYDFIDVIIREKPGSKNTQSGAWMDDWMPEKHILIDLDPKEVEFDQEITGLDMSTVAVRTHTSGTTGIPKIVDMTNAQILNLARHTIEYNEFTADDVPLHTKTLHHGSLFVNYAIPLLMLCQHHHDVDFVSLPGLSDRQKIHGFLLYAKDHGCTRVLMPYSTSRDLEHVPSVDLGEKTAINVIHGPLSHQIQDIFDRFRPRHVINMFGCSEMGTMMISRTTRDNIDSYHNTRFDTVNPYIDLVVEPDRVRCKWRDQKDWHVLADVLQWRAGAWWHCGRSSMIQSASGPIDITIISQYIIDKYHSNEFTVVPDFEKNLLYLAIYDDLLFQQTSEINHHIQQDLGLVDCFCDRAWFDKVGVLIGMKPSNPLLLYYFRNKHPGVLDGII